MSRISSARRRCAGAGRAVAGRRCAAAVAYAGEGLHIDQAAPACRASPNSAGSGAAAAALCALAKARFRRRPIHMG